MLLAYAALAVLLFVRTWAHPGSSWIGYDDDPHLFIWYLGWTPHQLAALRNPLFATVLQAPGGVNLMWNTAVVAPAIVLWPVTAAFGPIASYNVLVTAAVALSAWCGFLAARRFVRSDLAAAVAGLLYGFSPYMVAQSLRHPHVSLAVFPPLALLLLHEILVRQRWSPLLAGGLLGAAAAVQFLTGEEILAYTAIVAGLGVILLAALHPAEVASRAPRALAGLAVALGCFVLIAAYPLWFQFLGPQRVSGVLQPPGVYVNDLLGFVVPSYLMALSGGPTGAITGRFTGNVSETDAYLGIPLIALLSVACVLGWRRPLVRWAAPLAAVAALLSLGPQLHVGGTVLPVPLPGALVARLPLLESAVPSRLMLFAYLGVALVLADFVSAAGRRRGGAWAGDPPDPRRPCTPPHPRKSAPPGTPSGARRVEPRDFPGTPGPRGQASAVLAHPFQWARSGPRRLTTIWGTWPENTAIFAVARRPRRGHRDWTTNLSAPHRPTLLALAAVAVALVPLVPRWPYPSTDARVPAFFQPGGEVARLSPDDVVLVAPYADHLSSVAMLWQAGAGYRFQMPEGEAFVPGPSLGPPPSHLRTTFEALEGGVPVPDTAADRATTLRELAALRVGAVVAGPGPGHDRIVAYLTTVLGRPPARSGGVDVWWNVGPGAAAARRKGTAAP